MKKSQIHAGVLVIFLLLLWVIPAVCSAQTATGYAVGYVKIDIPAGGSWVQVATPFDASTGEPMTLDQVFGDRLPENTEIQFRTGSGYDVFTYLLGEWRNESLDPNGDYQMPRGNGCWLKTPNGTEAMELIVAGTVPEQGPHTVTLAVGYSIFGFGFPTETSIGEAGLNPNEGDTIQKVVPGSGYTVWTYLLDSWRDENLQPVNFTFQPGKAYWYYNAGGGSLTWHQPKLY